MIAKLEEIVISLKTDSNIYSILGDRIYIGQPPEEVDGIYLTVNIISQMQNQEVNNRTRVEFRFIGGSNLLNLSNIEGKVVKHIYDNFLTVDIFNIEIGTLANGYDDKKKPVLIRDMVFYMITNYDNG